MPEDKRFDETFLKTVGGNDPHTLLKGFSRYGMNVNGASSVEAAALAVFLTGANDIHPPERAETFSFARDQWRLKSLKLAAIGMERCDIAPLVLRDESERERFPMTMVKAAAPSSLKYSKINNGARQEATLNMAEWCSVRLSALERTLAAGASIVSLGEFDFPPVTASDEYAQNFSRDIQSLIDKVRDRPIFVIAGTRHEFSQLSNGSVCHNHAKIFVNDAAQNKELSRTDELSLPLDHPKIVSAEKMGEHLTPVEGAKPSYYETTFGRVAVLVCVDAYSPNLIFSMINSCGPKSDHKVDFVIIPAYNNSSKLYFASQVLSLACETVVMLVDACSQSTTQPARCEIFVGGRAFSEIKKDQEGDADSISVGTATELEASPEVILWDLNMSYVREAHSGAYQAMPLLNQVWPFRDTLQNRKPK